MKRSTNYAIFDMLVIVVGSVVQRMGRSVMNLSDVVSRKQASKDNEPLELTNPLEKTDFMNIRRKVQPTQVLTEKARTTADNERGINNLIQDSWTSCQNQAAIGLSMIGRNGFVSQLVFLILATRQLMTKTGKSTLLSSPKELPTPMAN